MNRPWLLPVLLGASFGVPYVLSHPKVHDAASVLTSDEAGDVSTAALSSEDPASAITAVGATTPVPTRLEGPEKVDFRQIFRFDLTPDWIIGQWARVSTAPGEVGLDGYRVPLVTGVRHDDLAGVLTYYFDRSQRLKRITFRGLTGDPRRSAAFAVRNLGMTPVLSDEPRTTRYIKRETAGESELKVVIQPLVEGTRPHERYEILFDLHRPDALASNEVDPDAPAFRPRPYTYNPW